MTPSENCIALIKASEGFRAEHYKDSAGFLTVGYGHKLAHAGEVGTTPWTEEHGSEVCAQDAEIAGQAVARLVAVALTQNQFDALTDFVFNLGSGRLAESTLLRLLNMAQYQRVPDELRKWVYGGGKVLPGLVTRRELEAELFIK